MWEGPSGRGGGRQGKGRTRRTCPSSASSWSLSRSRRPPRTPPRPTRSPSLRATLRRPPTRPGSSPGSPWWAHRSRRLGRPPRVLLRRRGRKRLRVQRRRRERTLLASSASKSSSPWWFRFSSKPPAFVFEFLKEKGDVSFELVSKVCTPRGRKGRKEGAEAPGTGQREELRARSSERKNRGVAFFSVSVFYVVPVQCGTPRTRPRAGLCCKSQEPKPCYSKGTN